MKQGTEPEKLLPETSKTARLSGTSFGRGPSINVDDNASDLRLTIPSKTSAGRDPDMKVVETSRNCNPDMLPHSRGSVPLMDVWYKNRYCSPAKMPHSRGSVPLMDVWDKSRNCSPVMLPHSRGSVPLMDV